MSAPGELRGEVLASWRALQPGRFPQEVPLIAAWLLLIGLAIGLSEEGGCTPQDPCTTDVGGVLETVPCLLVPAVLLVSPRVGLSLSWVALTGFVVVESLLGELPLRVVGPGVLLVALAAADASLRRSWYDEAVDDLASRAPQGRWTGPAVAPRPWALRAGAGLLVLAVGLAAWCAVKVASERDAESRAGTSTAVVVDHGDDGYVITVARPDGTQTDIDTADAGDYPVGSTQPVLVGEFGLRLLAEPYDGSWWLAGSVAAAVLGGALVARDREVRVALRRLHDETHPCFSVAVRDGRPLAVLGLDANGSDDALVTLRTAAAPLPAPDVSGVLHGPPASGRVALLSAADQVHGGVLGNPRAWPAGARGSVGDDELVDLDSLPEPRSRGRSAEQVEAALSAQVAPGRADRALRVLSALGLLGAVCALGPLVASEDGWFGALIYLLICGEAARSCADRLVHRVAVTREALVITGISGTLRLPWGALRNATGAGPVLLLVTRDGEPVLVDGLTPARRSRAARSAAVTRLAQDLRERIALAKPGGAVTRGAVHPALPLLVLALAVSLGLGLVWR